jgi:hypothetical protein
METPLRFWVIGFMNKWYNPYCSFFHYGRSIFPWKNVTERPNKKRTALKMCHCSERRAKPFWNSQVLL